MTIWRSPSFFKRKLEDISVSIGRARLENVNCSTPNLFENIGLLNQRTLLINRPTMGGPGKVVLKSSQAVLNILRVRLDWARPGVVRLVDNVPNGALVTTGGKMFAPEEVDGSPLTPIADSWEGRILTTSVTDQAERIEKGD